MLHLAPWSRTLISHTIASKWTKFYVFANTNPKKLLNHSEFLFSFAFQFYKMAPSGTVSHEFLKIMFVYFPIWKLHQDELYNQDLDGGNTWDYLE